MTDSWDGRHDSEGTVPPYPIVVLGQWSIGSAFPVRVLTKSWLDDPEASEFTLRGETQGELQVEVRLCIVPHGPDLLPTTALRIRPMLAVESLDIHTKKAAKWSPDTDNKQAHLAFTESPFPEEGFSCNGHIAGLKN
jgi:hypothetical protein